MVQVMTFFNVKGEDVARAMEIKVAKYVKGEKQDWKEDVGRMIKLKTAILRYLRYNMLFKPEDISTIKQAIYFLLKEFPQKDQLTVEDFN